MRVEGLFDQNKAGEGILTLANIIAEKNATVPRRAIIMIRELIDGFPEAERLPEDLDECAAEV